MNEPDVTDPEVGRIKACESAFKRAIKSLLSLQGSLSGPLFRASSVGDMPAFLVLKRAEDAVHYAKPFITAAHAALVEYRKKMEQVQVQHPGLVVPYTQSLGDALREAAKIDLEVLQTGATAVDFDTKVFAPLIEAVNRARHYERRGDI